MDKITQETRREAYIEISPKQTDRRNLILAVLGNRQMTVDELVQEMLDKGYVKYYDRNFVAPRLTELKDDGIVKVVGKRQSDRTGRNTAVWQREGM